MATTVVFADEDDACVYCTDATYTTARAGTGTLTLQAEGLNHVTDQQLGQGLYTCGEAFLNFNTSWLDPEVPLAVVLSVWMTQFSGGAMHAATTANVAPYTTASFIAGASLPAAQATLDTFSFGVYNDLTEISLLASINPTGLTSLVVFGKDHQDNVAPTLTQYKMFRPAETAGTSQDPKLTVYTPDLPGDNAGPYGVRHQPIAGERST